MKEPFTPQTNVRLAGFTTLKIGGNARYFIRAETEGSVFRGLEFAEQHNLPLSILGGGSNVLIADTGFDGLVLQIAISSGFRVQGSEFKSTFNSEPGTRNSELITAGAGEDWDGFVEFCVANDLAGVECLSGIPGFVGGTPVQNVGAYGQEVAETITAVRCFDRETKEFVSLTNAECGFTYRTSIFNSSKRDRYIVLSVTFALEKCGVPRVTYKDLIKLFGERQPSLREVREAVLQIRRSKSMVIDRDDPNSQSAGSFFKNPIVRKAQFAELQKKYARIPSFEFGDHIKIPAAWLIENSGFQKGFIMGRAGISTNHTLALINRGGATAAEMIALKSAIQMAVENEFGILLKPEPVFVGFDGQQIHAR